MSHPAFIKTPGKLEASPAPGRSAHVWPEMERRRLEEERDCAQLHMGLEAKCIKRDKAGLRRLLAKRLDEEELRRAMLWVSAIEVSAESRMAALIRHNDANGRLLAR